MSGLPDRITPLPQELFAETYGMSRVLSDILNFTDIEIIGGSLICGMIMLVLYGAAVLQVSLDYNASYVLGVLSHLYPQTYMYFLNYTKDHITLKCLVFVVSALATIHSLFVCHTIYHYEILTYTKPELLIDGEWSVFAATAVGVGLCFCIQMQRSSFYAKMLYTLSRKTWRLVLTIALGILILGQLSFGILLSAKLFQLWDLPNLKAAVYIAMVPLFTIRVASDTVTSIALCIILYDNRPSISRSTKLVNTLIMYAMNRFVLTTQVINYSETSDSDESNRIVVFVQTIILITKPSSIWAMVIEFVTSEIYVNSFLSTLNSRNHLREIGGTGQVISATGLSAARFRLAPATGNTVVSITQDVEVQKQFEVDFDRNPKNKEESYSMTNISRAV
ncbi:hypothetical protein C8J56DRAFT_1042837 [Mycena floridula]|nr:hypothetical protein C8J56DRAFT_1042837 [Mycena floridula]